MSGPLSYNPNSGGNQSTNFVPQANGPYIINVGIKQVVGQEGSQNFWNSISSNNDDTSVGTTIVNAPYLSPLASSDYNVYISQNLYVGGTIYGTVTAPSDIRIKENIESLELWDREINTKFMTLKPKSYSYIYDENHYQHFGYIAQDVEKVFPNLIYEHYDPKIGKKIMSVNYVEMIPLLHLKIKEQEKEIVILKKYIETINISLLREIQNIKTHLFQ